MQRNPNRPSAFQFWSEIDKKSPANIYSVPEEKAENRLASAASNAWKNASGAAYLTLPLITYGGIKWMTEGRGGYIDLSPLGFPIAVGGVVIDTVKAPITFAVATEEAARAGITKLLSLVFEGSPATAQRDRIFNSFLLRMRAAVTLLQMMGLEDEDVLNRKLRTGDIEDLVGYTLLLTAYASREYYSGLLLANGHKLTREQCPVEGQPLFDKIVALKETIKQALNSANLKISGSDQKARQLEESRIVCDWIKLIKEGKRVVSADKPDATESQLAVVNAIITQVEELKLRGMAALPKAPEEVVRSMPRRA